MSEFYLGSAFEGEDDNTDEYADSILFGQDADFDEMADERDDAAGDFGAIRRRRWRRRRKVRKLVEQILLPFDRTAVGAGAAGTLTVEPSRDCRLIDLRVIGSVLATGVEDPGITVTQLQVAGTNLFNAAGAFVAANLHPRDRRAGCYNCKVRRLVRQSTQISLGVTNVTAAAISVDGTLLVRARIQ